MQSRLLEGDVGGRGGGQVFGDRCIKERVPPLMGPTYYICTVRVSVCGLCGIVFDHMCTGMGPRSEGRRGGGCQAKSGVSVGGISRVGWGKGG